MRNIKALLLSILIGIIGFSSAVIAITQPHAYAQANTSNYEELSISLLHPYIEKAITEYYDYSRRYEIGDSRLEILARKGNIFTVKVSVDTFEGAHNNYQTEIMTFTVTPLSVTLNKYLHCDFDKY